MNLAINENTIQLLFDSSHLRMDFFAGGLSYLVQKL